VAKPLAISGTMISSLSIYLVLTLTYGESNPLEPHLWKNRVVIVYSNNTQDLTDQIDLFQKASAEFTERHLVVYGLGPKGGTYPNQKQMSEKDHEWFLKNYVHDKDDFLVILVGKDGGIKLKSHTPVGNSELFDLIDGMPMRIQEMKGQ